MSWKRIPKRPTARGMILGAAMVCSGCGAFTREEAREALEEAQMYSEAVSLIGTTVELSENFSIGQAVNDSAENLRDFYASQLPCASVELDDRTVTVEYGATGDECIHRGMTFTGTHSVTIEVNEETEVIVHHVWTELENGTTLVSGSADVTWSGGDDPSRRVVHDLSWTRLEDGRKAHGRGDRVQLPLDGDITEGFSVSGDATWQGASGRWELAIADVEMRWIDPVPQNGRYVLDTPFDKELTLEFSRASATSVDVSIEGGARQFEFQVRTPR